MLSGEIQKLNYLKDHIGLPNISGVEYFFCDKISSDTLIMIQFILF